MLAFVVTVLAFAPQQSQKLSDLVVPIAHWEATRAAEGGGAASAAADGGAWSAIELDGAGGGTAWTQARASFELPADFDPGDWMLCVGGSGLELTARMNGKELERVLDGCAGDPVLRAGPRFLVPAPQLRSGANRVEVAFAGAALGRGFERGPALLVSRTPAARLKVSAEANDLTIAIANFATLATLSRGGHLLDRVAFKSARDGGEPRLAAQLDCSLVDDVHGGEIPAREISNRRIGGCFPTLVEQLEDPRLEGFHGAVNVEAPVLTAPLRLSDAKIAAFELHQVSQGGGFANTWRLRFFPAVGGPLRVVRGERWILLRNDVVGLFAEKGRVLGPDDAPVGLDVFVSNQVDTNGRSLAGVGRQCGIVGFERDGLDPSQADSMEDLVESLLADVDESREASATLGNSIASEPTQGKTVPGIAARASAVATLAGMRRRGSRFVYAPPAGGQSAEAFWADTFSLLHFPQHERNAVEWLLSTQREDGAIVGDLPEDALDAELAAADAYAVLRACRWVRWTYDGDRFKNMVPQLAKALQHADAIDVLAPAAPPAPRERLSSVHVALARAAAHREFAAALEGVVGMPDLANASSQAAASQLDQLSRPVDQGGRGADAGFVDLPEEDAREQAFALAYGLVDDARAAAIASILGAPPVPSRPLDWRDGLAIRGLLQAGRVAALGQRFDRLDEQARTLAPSSAIASYHGALCFGLLGIRREDLGTIEIRPRMLDRQNLRTSIRIPEGTLRVTIQAHNARLERQVVVQNDSTIDSMVVVGVPGVSGPGRRVKNGELTHVIHEQVVPHEESWRELVR
jgi:hypothetical protein